MFEKKSRPQRKNRDKQRREDGERRIHKIARPRDKNWWRELPEPRSNEN